MLFRHRHAQHVSGALHFHRHGRVHRTRDALDLGLQAVVVHHANYRAGVVNPDQNCSAGGIGEGAYLPAEVGRHGPLELGGEPLTQGNQVEEG